MKEHKGGTTCMALLVYIKADNTTHKASLASQFCTHTQPLT